MTQCPASPLLHGVTPLHPAPALVLQPQGMSCHHMALPARAEGGRFSLEVTRSGLGTHPPGTARLRELGCHSRAAQIHGGRMVPNKLPSCERGLGATPGPWLLPPGSSLHCSACCTGNFGLRKFGLGKLGLAASQPLPRMFLGRAEALGAVGRCQSTG